MKIHELKTDPSPFKAVWNGVKTFELRKDDRDFRLGDVLHLREYLSGDQKYTGRSILARVSFLLGRGTDYGLQPKFVAMSIVVLCRDNEDD